MLKSRLICTAAIAVLFSLGSNLLPPATAGAQDPVGFPWKLLEGTADFNVALFLQGDLRGNFGPCG